MPRDLSDLVAGNRRQLRRSTSRFFGAAKDKQNGIFYGRQDVFTSVVTRLQDDSSGSFEDVAADRIAGGAVTIDGHELIAAAAIDQGSTPVNIVYGDDTSEADRFDTALGNQTGSLSISSSTTSGGLYEDPGTITLTSASTAASNLPNLGFEVGIEDGDGDLLSREVYESPSVSGNIRFVVELTLSPSASGQGVITDAGTKALTDAVIGSKKVFRSFAFSDQDDALDATLTSLPNETFRTQVKNDLSGAEVVVVGRVTTGNTPSSGFPYTIEQGGINDDTDDLVFASSNRPITVNDDTEFTAQASFVVRN
jgi:hypothetical protein